MKISFCIPSLNRPEYLLETLNSICLDNKYSSNFEVCIHNNFSDLSYDSVEKQIHNLSGTYNISYIKSQVRLDIDRSMYEAIKIATGDFLFFIGDDDYLDKYGLDYIYNLIENINFDLAVFNAFKVSVSNYHKVKLMGFSDKTFLSLDDAVPKIKRYCTYGNLLIKREFILESDFYSLMGTSHAYGCFWLAFFRNYEKGINPTIIVPNESVVNLRVVPKKYNLFDVVFLDTVQWFKVMYENVGERSKIIVENEEREFWNSQTTFLQLIKYRLSNFDLNNIKSYNPIIYKRNKLKIKIANFLGLQIFPLYRFIKFFLKL